MGLRYDIDKIFEELEEQARKELKKEREEKGKPQEEREESPDDAPETQEVTEISMEISEDVHGGNEDAKEIEDSPDASEDGIKSSESDIEQKPKGEDEKSKNDQDKKKSEDKNDEKTQEKLEGKDGKNPSRTKTESSPAELQEEVEDIFERAKKEQEDYRVQHRQEYLKKYMIEVIKQIAAKHAGLDMQEGSESFDKKKIVQHMMKKQSYKIMGDKYDLRDARYVQFFIDLSGILGCGSNKIMRSVLVEAIGLLEKQGYECHLSACSNGFYAQDMEEDNYDTRKRMKAYRVGKVNKIVCPTPETAAKMANDAEFSIIFADFDGLSSIVEMASKCDKEKVPYFLCTEDRYPWEDPTLHDWVDPELCEYNPELVYDVSMDGNPTLEKYEEENTYDPDMDDEDWEYDN